MEIIKCCDVAKYDDIEAGSIFATIRDGKTHLCMKVKFEHTGIEGHAVILSPTNQQYEFLPGLWNRAVILENSVLVYPNARFVIDPRPDGYRPGSIAHPGEILLCGNKIFLSYRYDGDVDYVDLSSGIVPGSRPTGEKMVAKRWQVEVPVSVRETKVLIEWPHEELIEVSE